MLQSRGVRRGYTGNEGKNEVIQHVRHREERFIMKKGIILLLIALLIVSLLWVGTLYFWGISMRDALMLCRFENGI